MDLRGLGALLTALGGLFTAKAGAQAGQLQGLLLGEDITERRKRMKMAEEAHQLQMDLARAQEAREAELFPLRKGLLAEDLKRRQALLPLEQEALATQVEAGKLNLLNQRLWSMYQRGVVPSQIADPALRAEYEPFFNYVSTANALQWVRSKEELQALLEKVSEEWRPSLELLGRESLIKNQLQQEIAERQLRGLDINLAQGELQLRTAKLNSVINIILNNINSEGLDWDKRTPQQKIEAVKKWIAQLGLQDVVPEDFANMFQRVKSVDARQYALYRAQAELQHRLAVNLANLQYAHNLSLQREGWWSNIVAGAMAGMGAGAGGGVGNIAPVGFMKPAPPPNIFNPTPDNQGSYLNQTALNKYLQPPIDVPVYYNNGVVLLSSLRGRVASIYKELAKPNGRITADDISTLITYDAGLQIASAQQAGMALDWNTALMMAVENVMPVLESNHLYRSSPDYRRVLNEWKRAWEQRLQQRAGGGQGGGQTPAPNMPRGQIGGQRTAPEQQPAQPRGSPNYTSSARRRREQ
jgi:hypothetical protein